MSGSRTWILATVVLLATVLASPAGAADPTGGVVDRGVWDADVGYTPGHGSGCNYTVTDPRDLANTADNYARAAERALEAAQRRGLGDNMEAELQADGSYVWRIDTPVMEWRYYTNSCGGLVWAPTATPTNLALGAFDYLRRLIPEPTVTFTPTDSTHGWVYTQVPTDITVEIDDYRLYRVRVSAGSAWGTAVARPRHLVFRPGDPLATTPPACNDPLAAFNAAVPNGCAYTYLNSSSITSTDEFGWEVEITWDVTYAGNGPVPPNTSFPTIAVGTVEVAEARPST